MNDELFGGMRPARVPPDLRDRALRAARVAAGVPDAAKRAGVRFTRFDLAWAAALLLLLAFNLLLAARGRSAGVVAANRPGAVVDTRADRDDRQLARELGVGPSVMAAARTPARPDAGEALSTLLDDPAFERL
jgi:hypothetical protein